MDTLISPPPSAPPPPRRRRSRLPVGRGLIAVIAVVGLLALAGGWAVAQAVRTPRTVADPTVLAAPQSGIAGEVSGASARKHLEALQRIADQNGGNRASGTPGYAASVDYVVGVLKAAGWDVRTEQFTHTDRRDGDDDHDSDRPAPTTDINIIAQTKTGDPNHVVMAGAHLDSVPEGPGINDNATGVAALLEIATQTGGSPDVQNGLRFAFWGGEELGMYGSTAYVAGLPAAERQKLKAYVNLDMLGSPNAGYFVQGGVGDESSEAGPAGSADVAKVLVEQLAVAGAKAENVEFDDGSDFAAFLEAGIPTGGLYAGDRKRKSADQAALWGGQQGEKFDRCYHQACDTIANVDAVAFDRNTDATAATLIRLAAAR